MSAERERWLRLSRLFDQAADLEGDRRAAFVAAECAHDPALRDALQRMLDADAAAHGLDLGAAVAAAGDLQDAEEEAERAIGERLGPWRLQALLGRGGMGSVYRAAREDGETGQQAAIKRLQRRWDGSAQAQRFLQERRILALLSHANIPALIDHGLDGEGRPWFALEYVDGQPLTEWADARALGLRERVVLFLQVCAAVQHAHERFVVHRDLKPANILVDGGGRARVLDFGVAKLLHAQDSHTRTGLFAGFTPEYAAPEQVSGGAVTAATDAYALGVLLYQLLCGTLPYRFAHADLRDAAEAITTRNPGRLDRALAQGEPDDVQARMRARDTTPAAYRCFVRGDLTRIVQTALAKEPERRYASVQMLAADLGRFLDGRPVSVSGDSWRYRARKFVRRNRGAALLGALTGIVVLLATVGTFLQSAQIKAHAREAERQAERAERVRDFALQLLSDSNPKNAGFGGDLQKVFVHTAPMLAARFSAQPDLLAQTADLLASTMSDSGEKRAAERLLREVKRSLGRDPSASAWARRMIDVRLSQETLAQGRAAETERLLHGAIGELSPTRPEHVPVLLDAWQVRAYQRLSQGRERDAIDAARTAARIARTHLPASDRARVHADLGLMTLLATTGAGATPEALSQGKAAYGAARAYYGQSHPVTRRSLKYLAMLQQGNGRFADAEASYHRLLALADDDGTRFAIGIELGSLLEDIDRFGEAQAAYLEAIAIGARINAADQQALLAARNNLAFARYRAADWSGAAAGFGQVADAWQRIHADPDHAYVLSARTRQAASLVESGELAAAARLLDALMPRLARHDPDFHPIALAVRSRLNLASGRLSAAQRDIDAAFEAAPRGDLSPRSHAALWLARAQVREAEGQRSQAIDAAARAAALLQDKHPWRNPERAQVAAFQLAVSKPAEARALCAAIRGAAAGQEKERDLPFQATLRIAANRSSCAI